MQQKHTTCAPHIGKMIRTVFLQSGMSVADFARKIHVERTTIYSLFERQSVDCIQLAKISLILKHNFLFDLEQHYDLKPKVTSLTLNIEHLKPETILQLTDLLNSVNHNS